MPTTPKQIPEITAIPTPTAGQETDIQIVVARESTYDNFKMSLAQIFTLATVSGAIKTALDGLSTLIAGNTSSITSLGTTKLNKVGETRTGLTANRAIIIDETGAEAYLTGTPAQVVGFNGSGKPVAVTPSVDIAGLTSKPQPIGLDTTIISDSEASGTNKKVAISALQSLLEYAGNGSDGAVTVSTEITLTRDMQYTSLTVSGTGIINTAGYRIFYTNSLTNNGIIRDIGGAGGNGGDAVGSTPGAGGVGWTGGGILKKAWGVGGIGSNAAGSNSIPWWVPITSILSFSNSGGGGGIGWGNITPSASGSTATNIIIPVSWVETLSYPIQRTFILGQAGGGWSGGQRGATGQAGGGGWGGGWSGGFVWLFWKKIPTGTGTISVAGGNGGNGGNTVNGTSSWSGGGGGGWSGGVIVLPEWTTMTTIIAWGVGGTAGAVPGGLGVSGTNWSNWANWTLTFI